MIDTRLQATMRPEGFVHEKLNHKWIDQLPKHSWSKLHSILGKTQGLSPTHSETATSHRSLVVCGLSG